MLDKDKHKRLEESLYRKKRAFVVLYIFFILLVGCAGSLGASLCVTTKEVIELESTTLANDALICFALSSALNFAFFVIFSALLYKTFFFMNPKNNEDSINHSQKLWMVICICTVIMVVAVITQSFGNEDLYSCIRTELHQDPLADNAYGGMICLATTWFVAFSAAVLFVMLILIVNIRATLVNTLMEHLRDKASK